MYEMAKEGKHAIEDSAGIYYDFRGAIDEAATA